MRVGMSVDSPSIVALLSRRLTANIFAVAEEPEIMSCDVISVGTLRMMPCFIM